MVVVVLVMAFLVSVNKHIIFHTAHAWHFLLGEFPVGVSIDKCSSSILHLSISVVQPVFTSSEMLEMLNFSNSKQSKLENFILNCYPVVKNVIFMSLYYFQTFMYHFTEQVWVNNLLETCCSFNVFSKKLYVSFSLGRWDLLLLFCHVKVKVMLSFNGYLIDWLITL